MKRSKNYTWLVLGIIVIILGIVLPFVAMDQSAYYEYDENAGANTKTFNIKILSKDEIAQIKNIVVEFDCKDNETRKSEVYYVKSYQEKNKYVYEFQVVINHDAEFIEEISEIEVATDSGSITISEKVGIGSKISIAFFICIVGGFMIFVNFFNNNSKNRVIEVKEIISSGYENVGYKESTSTDYNEAERQLNSAEEAQQDVFNATKLCDYCGTISNADEKVCSSCGAKFKK